MSNTYSLNALLNTTFQAPVIKKILQRGAEIGCLYLNGSDGTQGIELWSYEEATASIMDSWHKGNIKGAIYYSTGIAIKFQNVFFGVYFKEKFGLLAPYVYVNRFGWNKKSMGDPPHYPSEIDFEKYIRLFLLLVQDFTVVWIKTYDELGDLDLYDGYERSYPQVRDYPILTISPKFRVDVTMEIPYNYETIYNVLEHGERGGWKFFYEENLDAKQAAAAILKQSPAGNGEAYLACFVANITYRLTFTLRFNAFFMVTLTPLHASSVNLEQTVIHALDLCTDFVIFELNTFDARYNYMKTSCDSSQ